MLRQLWSDDPALALAIGFALAMAAGALYVFVRALIDARRTTVTTAIALRRDAFTPERRRRLRVLQGRFGSRRAS